MKTYSVLLLLFLPLLGISSLFKNASPSLTLRVGDTTPDFPLPSIEGNRVRLSDIWKEQPVVLAFSPNAAGVVYEQSLTRMQEASGAAVFEIRVSASPSMP